MTAPFSPHLCGLLKPRLALDMDQEVSMRPEAMRVSLKRLFEVTTCYIIRERWYTRSRVNSSSM